MSDYISDLKATIAAKLDVYELLDILEFTMLDLVEVLHESIVERIEDFEDALK